MYDSGADEAVIACLDSACPSTRADDETYADEKQVALAPNSAGGHEENGSGAGAKEEVARQQSDARKILAEEAGYGDRVGGEDGAQSGRKDGGEAQNEGDEVAPP